MDPTAACLYRSSFVHGLTPLLCLDLTTTHRQTWLFSSTSTYHSTDLLTARGVAHLVVHGTSGSTSYETIPDVRLETSGDVLSTVDMVVQRRDGPHWLRELDDDDVSYWLRFIVEDGGCQDYRPAVGHARGEVCDAPLPCDQLSFHFLLIPVFN